MDNNSYLTVAAYGEAEFTERRSRFIGAAIPVCGEKQALDFIAERRSKFWNATHNVYAYSLRDGTVQRFSDDSEPQGTAGMPTLDVLQKSGVTDVCVVTTRYFGGVLLGAGGLVRAYSHAASIALDAAGIVRMDRVYDCDVRCDYHMYGKLNSALASLGAIDIAAEFTDGVRMTFSVPLDMYNSLERDVTDLSNGQLHIQISDEHFAQIKI